MWYALLQLELLSPYLFDTTITAKQQAEINRMHDEMAQQRQSRKELSEEILRDARARLQMVQQQVGYFASFLFLCVNSD